MDSNVSKRTFLHKFFKLGFSNDLISLSVKELLKDSLLSAIDLFECQSSFTLDPQFRKKALGCKIVLLQSFIEPISFYTQPDRVLSTTQLTPIVYSSSIALALASPAKKSPQIMAQELIDLLIVCQDRNSYQLDFNTHIEITKSGLINFCLDSKLVAFWLEKSLALINTKIHQNNLYSRKLISSDNIYLNLFPAQYAFARCCSLLRLGKEERLWLYPENTQSISWLDDWGNLWLREEIEFSLIRQLFLITDSFAAKSANWHKLALHLSEITMVFIAECRFLGEVKQKTPQKAIARLGLIAITQYWLGRILVEKLNVCAPTSL